MRVKNRIMLKGRFSSCVKRVNDKYRLLILRIIIFTQTVLAQFEILHIVAKSIASRIFEYFHVVFQYSKL